MSSVRSSHLSKARSTCEEPKGAQAQLERHTSPRPTDTGRQGYQLCACRVVSAECRLRHAYVRGRWQRKSTMCDAMHRHATGLSSSHLVSILSSHS